MHLASHHKAALVGATVTSAIAVVDATTRGLTGHSSVFADDSGVPLAAVASAAAHGLTYLALALVLHREAHRFATANRIARGARWAVLASLLLLGPGFLLLAPVVVLQDLRSGPAAIAFGTVGTVGFVGMILGSLVLGLALLRTPALGIGARVLLLMTPVFAATLLVGWLAPAWGHPAYLETTLHVGLALLGATAGARATEARGAAPATPATAG